MPESDANAHVSRPKVLFITMWYPSRDVLYDGSFIREHAKAASLHADVRVLHVRRHRSGFRPVLEREADTTLTLGVPTYRLDYPRPMRWTRAVSSVITPLWAYRRIVADGFRPDLIHGNVYETALATVLLGKWHRLPTVISEHYSRFPMGEVPRLALATTRWSFKRADRVLPVSNFLRDAIAANGIEARFEVIPNAVDMKLFRPSTEERHTRMERLLFIGNLWPDDSKGLGVLLEALARLQSDESEWSLEVVGAGEGLAAYEHLAVRLGIAEQVEFTGTHSRSEVARRIRESDLLVVSSRMETQSVVILEALASGVPVLASDVGGIPETVIPGTGWLVPVGSVEALSASLGRLLGSYSDLERNALVQRAAQFSRERVGARLRDVYSEVIGSRSHD